MSDDHIERLEVALGERSYPIFIGPGLLEHGELLRAHLRGSQACIVTNETLARLHLGPLEASLAGELELDTVIIPDGEAHKNLATYEHIIDELMRLRHNRSTCLIALGGGVIGDITGFVAATFQRGVDFIQLPTTLLAQVDSSVGGKTAVNHARGKNMIGAFHQPRCVLADTGVLATLPRREYLAGIAEVMKYGVIRDAGFFGWLERRMGAVLSQESADLARVIHDSCAIKAEIVARDEREEGLRAILNFGHTFGHAIEALTGYRELLHGEAVAIGMVMAADLSHRLGRLSLTEARRIKAALAAAGLPVEPPSLAAGEWLDAMGMDKKVVDGRARFVVVNRIGEAVVTEAVEQGLLEQTLMAGGRLCDG